MAAVLAVFGAVEAADVSFLSDPSDVLSGGGVVAAAVGVGLLVGDVVLPVPSSLVMVAHGAVFGVLVGTVLSVAGTVGGALVGVWLGRRTQSMLGASAAERRQAEELFRRWGVVAVVVTRPVPVLAEAVVIMAGAAGASPMRVGGAAAIGGLPAAVLYALAGSVAGNAASGAVVFVVVVAIAGVVWLLPVRKDAPTVRET